MRTADGDDRSGLLIGGRYRLLEQLGMGGYGRVWKARDETLRIDVAVKEVYLPLALSPREHDERVQRAEREARNAAQLRDHPNVVAVHDVVVQDGAPWLVMQLIAGRTLEDQLASGGPLDPMLATRVATALLKALGAAHAVGIVHRDVKPGNAMLTDDGEVKLTDFGIAVAHADTSLTATGSVIGSMEYLAPERAEGRDGLAVSDLFSLGVTLYQTVQGESPFRRETPTGTLKAVLLDTPAPLTHDGPLSAVIMGLMEKDPERRLSVAQALAMIEGTGPARSSAPAQPVSPALPTQSAHIPPTTQQAPYSPPLAGQVAQPPDLPPQNGGQPPYEFYGRRDISVLGTALIAALGVIVICAITFIVINLHRYSTLNNLLDEGKAVNGHYIPPAHPDKYFAAEEAIRGSHGFYFVAINLAVISAVIAGVLTLCWFAIARANAETYAPVRFTLGRGWAIGAWFVPLASVVLPYLVARDIHKGTTAGRRPGPPTGGAVTGLWWTLWLACLALFSITIRSLGQDGEADQHAVFLRNTASRTIPAAVVLALAMIAMIAYVWKITAIQTKRNDELEAGGL